MKKKNRKNENDEKEIKWKKRTKWKWMNTNVLSGEKWRKRKNEHVEKTDKWGKMKNVKNEGKWSTKAKVKKKRSGKIRENGWNIGKWKTDEI